MIEIKGDFKMNKTILIATLAIVFVAGCTQTNLTTIFQQNTNTFVSGTGLVMTDFSADQPQAYNAQTDRIMVTVSNKGGHTVPATESLIYLTGQALQTNATNKNIYWSTVDYLIKPLGALKPADTVRDTPADEKTISWSMTAPNISRGESTSYLFIGRTYYKYETKVNGNVWVYSDTEADAARTSGKTLNKATWSATSGPVAINAKVTQDPVILFSGETTFTLVIKVGNAGGGVLYDQGAITSYATTNPNDLALTSDDINKVDVAVDVEGTPITTGDCVGTKELVGGKDLTLTCDVSTTRPMTFASLPITITAGYGYYTERTTSITVSGR